MADSAGSYKCPAKCQFCEKTEEMKWICFECNIKLCEICNRKIHLKIETNQNHKVIALKDINSEKVSNARREIDLENLSCEVHNGQKCVSFCLDCHVTLCLTCHDEHKNHNKKDLIKLYEKNIAEIQKLKHDFGEKQAKLDVEETNLTTMSDAKKREYKQVKDDIDKRETDIISRVLRYSKTLHDKVDKEYQSFVTKIKTELLIVQKTKIQLKEKRGIVDNILHSHQPRDVLVSNMTVRDIPIPKQYEEIPTTIFLFTAGDSLDSKIRHLFGEVNQIPELKLVNTYQTELTGEINIINWEKNEKVFSSSSSGKLQRVKFDKDSMTLINEEGIKVFDMALKEDNDVVISSRDNELMTYSKEGTIKLYKSFHPLLTLGVHVNRYNEVLVGLTEERSLADVRPDSITKIMVLDQAGDIQHTYQYTKDRQRLFTWPRRIITCHDIICVVDTLNDPWEWRVVALDYGGHVQWVYNGDGNKGQNKFYPRSMAVTLTDQILIADGENDAIHILNPGGQVIVCHHVEDLRVQEPISLCMDNEGLLWVGCDDEENNTTKIYTMTIV